MKRRVGSIDGYGRGLCQEVDLPELKAGEVKVAVRASMISPGTELGSLRHLRANPEAERKARIFGYTNAGVVEEVGEGVEQFEVGQRVACMGGGYALHTDIALVPQNLCVALPDEVSFEEGSSVHLAATALHAIRRSAPVFGENGMVLGLGLVGQMSAQFGQLSGCHMMGVDRFPRRLEAARQAGVEAVVQAEVEDPVARSEEVTQGYGMDFGVIVHGFWEIRGIPLSQFLPHAELFCRFCLCATHLTIRGKGREKKGGKGYRRDEKNWNLIIISYCFKMESFQN